MSDVERARQADPVGLRDEAIEKALLYVFQIADKDYRKMQTVLSESAFVRALEQDGWTVVPASLPAQAVEPGPLDVRESLSKVPRPPVVNGHYIHSHVGEWCPLCVGHGAALSPDKQPKGAG